MTQANKLSGEEIEAARALCLSRFRYFAQAMVGPVFYDDNIHGRLTNFLQDAPTKDKLVVMPRVHLKTTIGAVWYSIWRALKNPNIRILLVSNIQPNAAKTVGEIRRVFESNTDFQILFPEAIPTSFNKWWSDESACISRPGNFPEGTFESAGTGTQITRRHYDLIIEDDTVAPKKSDLHEMEQMPTREDIEQAIGFHKATVHLLISFAENERIIIGTRWGMFDLIQHIMDKESVEQGGRFSILDVPAIDPNTGRNNYKRFSLESLESIRKATSSIMFNMLYLNRPQASSHLYFKPENTQYYEAGDLSLEGENPVVSVDPADPPTGKSDQCYTVALAGVTTDSGLYVLEYVRDRLTAAGIIKASLDLADKWKAIKIRVEADRYPHLAAGFKIEMAKRGKYYVVEEVKTRGRKKEARILRLTPLHENHCLFIKKGMRELETEMYSFDRGLTNDILDALAWQVLDNYQAPAYGEEEKPARKGNARVFQFDEIQRSVRRKPAKYPFPMQMGAS